MPSVLCSCGKTIETKPEWAGAFVRCRGCAAKVYVPRAGEAAAPPPLPAATEAPASLDAPAEEADLRACPYCAEMIRKQAVKCRFCGQSLVLAKAGGRPTRVRTGARPSRVARTDTGGTGILVMGILGWAVCGIFNPIAWAMGASHEARCRAAGIEPSGAAKAGKILGMIGTILLIVGVLIVIVVLAAGGLQ